ncbi:MAG: hypothetical protein U0835_01860 [Isosphaeraceae bacterium]
MNDVPVMVCACGKRLRAPGARPGRVGRCPACGGMMRVPDEPPAGPVEVVESTLPAGAYTLPGDDAPPKPRVRGPGEPAPKPRRKKKGATDQGAETAIWDGLISAPKVPEPTARSFLYPLWGATGVAALVVLPPLLWVTSVMVFGGLTAAFTGGGGIGSLLGLLMFLPSSIGLFAVGGYALLFLARVLAASALGEPHHPRWPDWELSTMAAGLGRWLWAGFVGLVVGGVPALTYWVYCGDVDFFEAVILTELAAAGAVYALMALVASILHEDLAAANPFTVLGAVWTVGWGYAVPCLACGASVFVCGGLLLAAVELEDPFLAAVLMYGFWVAALYLGMVVLRVLGLCYFKKARALGWFRGRTRWGV